MIASGNRTSIGFVKEITAGVTPPNPSFQLLRYTKGAMINLKKDTMKSEEVRSDRMTTDMRHGVRSTEGTLPIEMSYGSHDELLAATFMNNWNGDELTIGTLRPTYSFIYRNEDIGLNTVATGVEVTEFSLELQDKIVSASFTLLGLDARPNKIGITGDTYLPQSTSRVMDAFSGEVKINGVAVGVVGSLKFALKNSIEHKTAVGKNTKIQGAVGSADVTCELSIYFTDNTIRSKFDAEQDIAINFSFGDGTNSYEIDMPKCPIGGTEISGDTDLTLATTVTPIYDPVAGYMIKMTRVEG